MRTTYLFGLVALVCVLKLGVMLFGPGDASTEQAVHARMQAENDQMRDRLHWMKDAEIWDFAKKELDHCAAEEEEHGDDQVGGGGCYDFANKIAELKTQKNSKLMQREGAVDLLVKHHMHQLSMRTSRGTLANSAREVHKAGWVESATALTKVLTQAEGR